MSWKARTSIANIRNWEKLAKPTRHTRRYNRTCWLTTEKQYCIQGNFSTWLTLSSGGTFKTGDLFSFPFNLSWTEKQTFLVEFRTVQNSLLCTTMTLVYRLWPFERFKNQSVVPISIPISCFMFKLDTLTRVKMSHL